MKQTYLAFSFVEHMASIMTLLALDNHMAAGLIVAAIDDEAIAFHNHMAAGRMNAAFYALGELRIRLSIASSGSASPFAGPRADFPGPPVAGRKTRLTAGRINGNMATQMTSDVGHET